MIEEIIFSEMIPVPSGKYEMQSRFRFDEGWYIDIREKEVVLQRFERPGHWPKIPRFSVVGYAYVYREQEEPVEEPAPIEEKPAAKRSPKKVLR